MKQDKKAASKAMSHAVAIGEPSDRFNILVDCAHSRGRIDDLPDAVNYFIEADSLGQLDFEALRRLGGFQLMMGDAAAAVGPLYRAAVMDPSDGTVRQRLGSCKLVLEDAIGAIADLDAAISLGLESSVTYRSRGVANWLLRHFDAALADLHQAVAMESEEVALQEALMWRAEVKRKLGDHEGAVADDNKSAGTQPVSLNHFYLT